MQLSGQWRFRAVSGCARMLSVASSRASARDRTQTRKVGTGGIGRERCARVRWSYNQSACILITEGRPQLPVRSGANDDINSEITSLGGFYRAASAIVLRELEKCLRPRSSKQYSRKRSAWFARCPYRRAAFQGNRPGKAPAPFDPIPTTLLVNQQPGCGILDQILQTSHSCLACRPPPIGAR